MGVENFNFAPKFLIEWRIFVFKFWIFLEENFSNENWFFGQAKIYGCSPNFGHDATAAVPIMNLLLCATR